MILESRKFASIPNATIRVSFIGYRDFCDAERFVLHDFVDSRDTAPLKSAIARTEAKGGGDGPEDVVGGLQKVLTLSWRCSTRVVIHAADAPCHGRNYHNLSDSFPDGDPSGVTPEEVLKNIERKRIHYYFVQINNSTTRMTSVLSEVYRSSDYNFGIHPLGDNASGLLPAVLESIKASVNATNTNVSEQRTSALDSIAMLEAKIARLEEMSL